MRTGRPVVVSDPVPPQSVLDRALEMGADLWQRGHRFQCVRRQAAVGLGRARAPLQRAGLPGAARREPAGQRRGRAGGTDRPARAPAGHRAGGAQRAWRFVELPGRFQIIPGQPSLVLDVAHNPHSVAALAANLDAMGFFPTTHAIFGAMADKELAPMLAKVGPMIDRWYFTDLPSPRAASGASLQAQWQAQNSRKDASATTHARPHAGAGRGHRRGRPR